MESALGSPFANIFGHTAQPDYSQPGSSGQPGMRGFTGPGLTHGQPQQQTQAATQPGGSAEYYASQGMQGAPGLAQQPPFPNLGHNGLLFGEPGGLAEPMSGASSQHPQYQQMPSNFSNYPTRENLGAGFPPQTTGTPPRPHEYYHRNHQSQYSPPGQSPPAGPPGAQAGDTQGGGGGNIGTGSVPTPGEPGFSANTGKGAA